MDGRGCLVLVAINDAFSLSLVPFALGRGGGRSSTVGSIQKGLARPKRARDPEWKQ